MSELTDARLLAALLETVTDQVYFKDLASRFLRTSATQARKLGYSSAEELIGKTDFDVFAGDHAREAFEDEQRIIATGEPVIGLEERETFPDGREAWVSTSKHPLRDERGDIVGTLGITRDITVRKRSEEMLRKAEERWRMLLAHMEEIVWLANDEHGITYANPATERCLGYGEEELLGRTPIELCHEEDRTALLVAMATVVGEPRSVQYRARTAQGDWRWLEATFVRLEGDPAEAALLMAARDVTARVALEEERHQLEMERRVSQRLEAVGQLAAGIAHEINTPLQFVGDSVNFVDQAVDELLGLVARYREILFADEDIPVSERRRAMLEAEREADLEYLLERIPPAFRRTADGVERVRSIVDAMKRFSHAGGSEYAAADVNEGIATTLAVCRSEYRAVAEVSFHPGDLPPVRCNINELGQVFLNLILNAVQAISEKFRDHSGQGRIEIATALDQDEVVVTIADNGPGIPAALHDRIYEPFFTTKEVGTGTGQGLALARTTIAAHGGTLGCQSTPGEGATFTIRLPVSPPDTAGPADP